MSLNEPTATAWPIPRFLRAIDRKTYIVSPLYDWVFFIGSPTMAIVLAYLLLGSPLNNDDKVFGYEGTYIDLGIGAFIFAHLVIVIFRSHLNPKIFSLYPYRFTLIPLVLFLAMVVSPWVLVFCSVLATFWDVYHSGMQTFGLSRIYDARRGNHPFVGRRLDWMLNVLVYAGPIAAGATLMDHVEDFNEFEEVGSVFFTQIPAYAESNASYLTWIVLSVGVPFVLFYLYSYWRYYQQGYKISPQKVYLVASTALCSIYAWGFNPFGMAFFIMNFFHAFQYFGIIWWAEKGNMARVMGLENHAFKKVGALVLLLGVGFGYGFFVELEETGSTWLFAFFLLISLMHFWYDSFIWSVVKKQV